MCDARRGSEEYGTFAEVSYCAVVVESFSKELRLWKEAGCTRGCELLTFEQGGAWERRQAEGVLRMKKSYWGLVYNEVRRGTKDSAEYSVQCIFLLR